MNAILSSTDPAAPAPSTDAPRSPGARLYTWISDSGRVIEQVRVVRRADGLRARGHVVAAADERDHPAFSLAYEAEVGSDDALRRVGLTVTTEDHHRSVDLARDDDGAWLLSDGTGHRSRVGGEAVVDVDITFSVFFASVMIRRHRLHAAPGEVDERVLSVDATTLEVTEDSVTFSSDAELVHGITGTASTSATVDRDAMIVDVTGLARRA